MENLRVLLENSVDRWGDRRAYTLKGKSGKYRNITYKEYYDEIRSLGEAFIKKGFAGERTAIIGKNSYEWFLVNAAVQFSGGVSVPLDKELKYGELESSLIRCEATVIFYDKKQADLVEEAIASGKTSIERAITLYKRDNGEDIFDLLERGMETIAKGETDIDNCKIDDDAVSFLLFTSGTTAQSKIVMLSQKNIYVNVASMMRVENFYETDTNIALLPYHHTFGSTGQWVMLAAGMRTVYCDGLKHLQKNLKEYGVSVFVGVPLIVESIYKKILKTAEKQGMLGRIKVFSKLCRGLNRAGIDIRRKIFKGILEALGGELRLVNLGAAAADPECMKGFESFGILAIQGYGLTESAPVLTAERETVKKEGSVGIPLDNVEIKIFKPDENGIGEVIARGENIMKGYYHDEEATADVLRDGWFHTGDLGYVDKDGFLFLTGRKKNVIVLKNGKNVFPEELESLVEKLPYQVENIVVGIPAENDERNLTVSLKIVYDSEYFGEKTRAEIKSIIDEDIEKINDTVPLYKRIKRIYITDEPMVKTCTAKIKRFKEVEKIIEEEKNKIPEKAVKKEDIKN